MAGIRKIALFGMGLLIAVTAPAQQDVIHPKDTSALHPPPGAKVAIVEFADMECPMCGMENPVILQAVEKYHVAWVRHDFPLPQHIWSFQALSMRAGSIPSRRNWETIIAMRCLRARRASSRKTICRNSRRDFAQQNGVGLPFVMDPQGTLTAEVKADAALANRIGISETPTAWS